MLVCPQCHQERPSQTAACAGCGLKLDWVELVAEDFRTALRAGDWSPCSRNWTAPRIEKLQPQDVPLKGRSRLWIGRRMRAADDPHIELGVTMDHCVVVPQPGSGHYWLADAGSTQGTFVNRHSVRSVRLQSGDLLQIGPYAWIFSGEDGYLVPVSHIAGVSLELVGLGGTEHQKRAICER
jgi:hypothetical protein